MKWLLVVLIVTTSYLVYGQELQGVVLDEFHQPMPYVYIVNTTQQTGTISSDSGIFYIKATKDDTIRMTFIGYKPLILMVDEEIIQRQITTTMAPQDIFLQSVWVFSDMNLRVPKRYKGQPMKIPGISEPGQDPTPQISVAPMINQYYAPGVAISGALSYFTKENIEKRKAIEAEIATAQIITYAKLMELESTRNELKTRFNLSDRELDRLLIVMNLNQPAVQQLKGKKNIMSHVTAFISSRTQGNINFKQ
ncbi:MAG: hypothetical protein HQ474_01545 [Flammeovirgaceae bacterium]|jgi:hypothetical protein|nr:hypothetical protein [Flammeovirgaceae bacterium]|tara:strand:+ start:2684 stop:3436 length:753 start_codon:yes stop_codon:yes gene_type:complete